MSGIIVEALVDSNRTVVEVEDTALFVGGTSPAIIEIFHGPPGPTGTDATTTTKGVVQLAGDLGGTAAAPTVPALASKVNTSSVGVASGVASLDSSGKLLTAQRPTYTDATSSVKGILQLAGDLSGTAASPTVPGLAGKVNVSSLGTSSGVATLGVDGILTPVQRPPVNAEQVMDAVAAFLVAGPGIGLVYEDLSDRLTITSSAVAADATTTTKGVVRLAGDLSGTALSPTVPGLVNKIDATQKGAPNGVASLGPDAKILSAQVPAVNVEEIQDAVAAMLVAGSGISLSYSDTSNTLTVVNTGGTGGGTTSDATNTTKGVVQLAGDLGGTAAAPTVPALASKVNTSSVGVASGVASLDSSGKLLTAQRPDPTDASTSTKGVVQLAGDLAGTSAAPTVPALANKINAADKGVANGVASLDATGKVPASQIAASSNLATTTTPGVIQLAGDLAGTATAPTVPGLIGAKYAFVWNGTGYINSAGALATANTRPFGTYRDFTGPANPNARGMMADGDYWYNTTSQSFHGRFGGTLTPYTADDVVVTPTDPPPSEITIDKYASLSGSDSNPGTFDLPYRTVQKLADNILAGQVGAVMPGTYSVSTAGATILNTGSTNHGTSSQMRRIISMPGQTRAKLIGCLYINSSYTSVEGFSIDTFSMAGTVLVPIGIGRASHQVNGSAFRNNIVDGGNSACQGLLIGGGSNPANNVQVTGNWFKRIVGTTGAPGHGVYAQNCNGLYVVGNIFSDIGTGGAISGDRAIQLYPVNTNSYVGYNTINFCTGGLVTGGSTTANGGHTLENCIISNLSVSTAGGGRSAWSEDPGTSAVSYSKSNFFYNNANGNLSSGINVVSTGDIASSSSPAYVNAAIHDFNLQTGSPAAGKGAYSAPIASERPSADMHD